MPALPRIRIIFVCLWLLSFVLATSAFLPSPSFAQASGDVPHVAANDSAPDPALQKMIGFREIFSSPGQSLRR